MARDRLAAVALRRLWSGGVCPGGCRPGPPGRRYPALRFDGLSLLLGFALFQILPQGYVLAGFGMVESVLLVVAAINIHHFVVDAFIWRLRPGTDNRRIVEAGAQ